MMILESLYHLQMHTDKQNETARRTERVRAVREALAAGTDRRIDQHPLRGRWRLPRIGWLPRTTSPRQ